MQLYHTAVFISRNKDNDGLAGYHAGRSLPFRVRVDEDEGRPDCANVIATARDALDREFLDYVNSPERTDGETVRMYVSLNAADESKVLRALQHMLINGDVTLGNIDSQLVSLIGSPQCALTDRWLFDVDGSWDEVEDVAGQVRELIAVSGRDPEGHVECVPTRHNGSVVTDMGLDVRPVLAAHPSVEFKRGGALLYVTCMTAHHRDWKAAADDGRE